MGYIKNQQVKIIKQITKHGFPIGSIVTLTDLADARNGNLYFTATAGSRKYMVHEKDIKPFKEYKYNVDDMVKVIGNVSGHHFEFGDVVSINSIIRNSYVCVNDAGDVYHMVEEELSPIGSPVPESESISNYPIF